MRHYVTENRSVANYPVSMNYPVCMFFNPHTHYDVYGTVNIINTFFYTNSSVSIYVDKVPSDSLMCLIVGY